MCDEWSCLPTFWIWKPRIRCSDISARAVRTINRNIEVMGFSGWIEVNRNVFFDLEPPTDPGKTLLLLNPPYGVRIGDGGEARRLYRRIGAKIRSDFRGCGYAIIVPALELEKVLALPHDRKIVFPHGGLRVSVLIRDGLKESRCGS